MPKKRFSAKQIVTLLRQIEVAMGHGKSTQIACREAGISEQSFYLYGRLSRCKSISGSVQNLSHLIRRRLRFA